MNRQALPSPDAHLQMADDTIEMLKLARELFLRQRRALVGDIMEIGQRVHHREKTLTAEASGPELERIFVPMHFERIGDNIEAFARAVHRQLDEGVVFTDRALREIDTLTVKSLELLEATRDILRTGSDILSRYVRSEGATFEALATEFALFHQERLIQGLCQPRASSIYLAIVDYLRGIERHVREIVQKLPTLRQSASAQAGTPIAHEVGRSRSLR